MEVRVSVDEDEELTRTGTSPQQFHVDDYEGPRNGSLLKCCDEMLVCLGLMVPASGGSESGKGGVDRSLSYNEISRGERKYVRERVQSVAGDDGMQQIRAPNQNNKHGDACPVSLALAFSGGGLRAASEALGALRFLKENGELHTVDYISSVSGGGYTASGYLTHLLQYREDLQHNPNNDP